MDELFFGSTRGQQISFGFLLEVPEELARQAGIDYPIAITRSAWAEYINVPEKEYFEGPETWWHDEKWWLVHLLWRVKVEGSEVPFTVRVRNSDGGLREVALVRVFEVGDGGEPVATVMLPDEV